MVSESLKRSEYVCLLYVTTPSVPPIVMAVVDVSAKMSVEKAIRVVSCTGSEPVLLDDDT